MAWSLEARGVMRHVRGRRSNVGVRQAGFVASVDVFGDIETWRGGRAGAKGRIQNTKTYLMQCMPTLWHDVRLLAGQPEAEAQRLEADRAVVLVLRSVVARDYWQGRSDHGCVGVERAVLVGLG